MKLIVCALVLFLGITDISHAQDQRAQVKTIIAQERSSPGAAFDAMMQLAGRGYAPALDRVGYYFRHGIGTQQDLERAGHWYAQAVAAGHLWSSASLARVHIALEQGDAAYELLQTAVAENRPGTRRLLATAHIDQQLGAASNPDLGRHMLEAMAEHGNSKAARDLVARINWGRLPTPASDIAVSLIVQSGLEGEVKFAETALTYLSRSGKKRADVIETRALLVDTPGLRDQIASVERIRLAADQTPRQFWTKVEQVLADTYPENYARAASTAFWINKNSWVRVLQKELRNLGYYTGAAHGRMTTRTIRAQNRFCKDADIWHICAKGPLRGPSVRAVANAIANRKKDGET